MHKLMNRFHAIQSRIASRVHAFARDEEGATMIEYALIATLISIAAIAVLTDIGDQLQNVFQQIVEALTP
jgi:pilus assembly protein Flp/PilA